MNYTAFCSTIHHSIKLTAYIEETNQLPHQEVLVRKKLDGSVDLKIKRNAYPPTCDHGKSLIQKKCPFYQH
jgi:hypothetical protein